MAIEGCLPKPSAFYREQARTQWPLKGADGFVRARSSGKTGAPFSHLPTGGRAGARKLAFRVNRRGPRCGKWGANFSWALAPSLAQLAVAARTCIASDVMRASIDAAGRCSRCTRTRGSW
jgi:hypothetical protein